MNKCSFLPVTNRWIVKWVTVYLTTRSSGTHIRIYVNQYVNRHAATPFCPYSIYQTAGGLNLAYNMFLHGKKWIVQVLYLNIYHLITIFHTLSKDIFNIYYIRNQWNIIVKNLKFRYFGLWTFFLNLHLLKKVIE